LVVGGRGLTLQSGFTQAQDVDLAQGGREEEDKKKKKEVG
jgi:hypothetical protein